METGLKLYSSLPWNIRPQRGELEARLRPDQFRVSSFEFPNSKSSMLFRPLTQFGAEQNQFSFACPRNLDACGRPSQRSGFPVREGVQNPDGIDAATRGVAAEILMTLPHRHG